MKDDVPCGFCHRGKEVEDVCEKLWQINNTKTCCTAHWKCMKYSSNLTQYKDSFHFGGFLIAEVEKEIKRGKKQKCKLCLKDGATAGCPLRNCSKTYHLYCAEIEKSVITERLDIEGTVLYRVFCSREHQNLYKEDGYKKDIKSTCRLKTVTLSGEPTVPVNALTESCNDVTACESRASHFATSEPRHNDIIACEANDVESDDSDASESLLATDLVHATPSSSYIELDELVTTSPCVDTVNCLLTYNELNTRKRLLDELRSSSDDEYALDGRPQKKKLSTNLDHELNGSSSDDVMLLHSGDNDRTVEPQQTSVLATRRYYCKPNKKSNDTPDNVKRVCSLCIPVLRGEVSPADRDVLLEFAVKSLSMKYHDVYIWRYHEFDLTEQEIIGLLYSIVQEMRPGNELKWLQLVFNTTQSTLAASKLSVITDVLLKEAITGVCNNQYNNEPVVTLNWIESINAYAAFFLFNDVTDPQFSARRRLPSGFLIHRYTVGVGLKGEAVRQTNSDKQREMMNLFEWMRSRVEYNQILVFPRADHILIHDDNGVESVCERLRLKLNECLLRKGSSRLVFVRPTCRQLVSHCGLLVRVIKYALSQLLTARHSVYIVSDIVNVSLDDVFAQVDTESVRVTIYTGMKFRFATVSAVVIHLSLYYK